MKLNKRLSTPGANFIKSWEGLVLVAASDGFGTPTVGWGHTSAAGRPRTYPGMKITEEQAEIIFQHDMLGVEAEINRLVEVDITQSEIDSLCSFEFNTGGLARSSLLKIINAGGPFSAATIAHDFGMWCDADGRPDRGLMRRRAAEAALFNKGVYEHA